MRNRQHTAFFFSNLQHVRNAARYKFRSSMYCQIKLTLGITMVINMSSCYAINLRLNFNCKSLCIFLISLSFRSYMSVQHCSAHYHTQYVQLYVSHFSPKLLTWTVYDQSIHIYYDLLIILSSQNNNCDYRSDISTHSFLCQKGVTDISFDIRVSKGRICICRPHTYG